MHQTNNARFLDLLWRHVLSLGLLTVAFLVSYSRYARRENPNPTPCPLVLLDSWSLLEPTVDMSPRAYSQGSESGARPLHFKGSVLLPLAAQSLLSPR